ncbi:MAG: RNA polymerase subunit sigma-24 [Flavobacteriales bacterium]|nr:MAG: RNA polymerase subunit sigma-24 [Flavobacteriales bacterium]
MIAAEDSVYIEKVMQGDTAAFAKLVDRYKDLAYTIALRIVRSSEDAEEVAQDSFLKAYQNLNAFKGTSRFSTWLYTIVYNTAVSKTRKKQLEMAPVDDELIENYTPDLSASPLDELKGDEQKKYVKAAIDRLPKTEALLITLYYLDECTVEEIYEITGLSVSNIKVKLHRARKKLHLELKRLLEHELEMIL